MAKDAPDYPSPPKKANPQMKNILLAHQLKKRTHGLGVSVPTLHSIGPQVKILFLHRELTIKSEKQNRHKGNYTSFCKVLKGSVCDEGWGSPSNSSWRMLEVEEALDDWKDRIKGVS